MTITPFLHYGMYSGKFNLPDSIQVWEFVVDGKRLNLLDLSAKNADNIIEPVRIYSSSEQSMLIYENNINRILSKARIPHDKSSFECVKSQPVFANWYKKHVSTILKKDITNIQVYQSIYSVTGATLKKLQSKAVYAIN